jgi:phospholipid/cholesterol/gamma-HCH transport system substrate-binding protein
MALQTKKKWAQLRVGLLAITALVLLAFLIFLLTSSRGLFKTRTEVFTYLDDSAAIAQGAPVRLNGINVGLVSKVALSGLSEPNRIVKMTMEIENEFLPSIPSDSQAAIAAENLLGTKYINIKKGRLANGIMAGAELRSLDTREFDDVVQQGYTALSSLDGIFKKLDGVLDQVQVGKGTIGKLLVDETLYDKLVGITTDTNKVVASLNSSDGTLGKLIHDDAIYTELRGTLTRVNSLADTIQKGQGTAGKLLNDPALYDDTRATIGDFRQLIAGLNKGEGDAGKFLKSEEIHNELRATMGRLDTLLDKINSGQGTLGQLVVNPSLYQSLDLTTRETNALLKDFRANPKKFLHIKLGLF